MLRWFRPRSHHRCRGLRGQIATYLTLLMALILMMAMVTVNVGKVAMTKLQTGNAADAGALAGASWAASTDNEGAEASDLFSAMFRIYQGYLALSFVRPLTPIGFAILVVAFNLNQELLYSQAKDAIEQGNNFAQFQATHTAFANAGVDDPRDKSDPASFAHFLQKMADDIKNGNPPNKTEKFTWDRVPSDPARGENTVTVHRNMPDLAPERVPGVLWCFVYWIPCIPLYCCWSTLALEPKFLNPAQFGMVVLPLVTQATLGRYATYLNYPIPWYSPYLCCPIPIPTRIPPPGSPVPFIASLDIPNHTDDVVVSVTHEEQGADLRLWQFIYRDPSQAGAAGIKSKGKAHFGGGRVRGAPNSNPRDTFRAKLVEAQ